MYHVHTLLLHTCYRIHSLAQAYCNWSTRCSSSPTSPWFRISFRRRPFVPMPSLDISNSKTPPIRLQLRLPAHKPQESAGACRKTNAILVFLLVAIDPDKSIAFFWQFRLTLFLAAEHLRVVSTPHLSQGATPWPGGPAHKPNCWELGFVLRCMMTEECRHRGGEIRFICTLWNIMITYQEDPLITTWKLCCDSQTVPGACRINLMKGLIRPFHYTCHTCQTEATGHGALSARSGCIVFDRCSDNVEAWTSSRTFTHDPPTAYCQGIGDRMASTVVLRGVLLLPAPFRSFKFPEGQNQSGWNQLHGARHACLQVGFQCLTRNTNSLPDWEDDWFMIQVVGNSPVPYWHSWRDYQKWRTPHILYTP